MGLKPPAQPDEKPPIALLLSPEVTPDVFAETSKQRSQVVSAAAHVFDLSESEATSLHPGDALYHSLSTLLARKQEVLGRASSLSISSLNISSSTPNCGTQAALPGSTGGRPSTSAAAASTSTLVQHTGSSSSSASTSGSAAPGSSPSASIVGRLGPRTVRLDQATASGSLAYGPDGLHIESTANFSSCRANVCVFTGRWMYEATVLTSGIQQIGWCTAYCPFTAEEGVGDAPDSYALDGKRVRKWNVKCLPYGTAWAPGDVIGCCIDLDAGTISFARNGVDLGVAYSTVRTMQPHLAYFPAVSLSYTEICQLNFGARPMEHPIPGYAPLQAPPPAAAVSMAAYLAASLHRLVACVTPLPMSRSAASSVNEHATDGLAKLAMSAGGQGDAAAASSSSRRASASTAKSANTLPSTTAAAADTQKLGVQAMVDAPVIPVSRFELPWEERLLLGATIVQRLVPLLLRYEYLVSSTLLPLLLQLVCSEQDALAVPRVANLATFGSRAASGRTRPPRHSGGSNDPPPTAVTDSAVLTASASAAALLQPALQLLQLCSDDSSFESLFASLLSLLAGKVVISPVVPQQQPHGLTSLPFLQLASALMTHQGVKHAWLCHPHFMAVTEALLTRKAPSREDLKLLVPEVWWPGAQAPFGAEAALMASCAALENCIAQVEEQQFMLLSGLLGVPSVSDPQEDVLLEFLGFLVHKNRGSNRDIPPPGLSDQTVLISAFFMLLRLLRSALYRLESFPAALLFVKTASKSDLEPVNDLGRLGGIVTHLVRESRVTGDELLPIPLSPAPPLPAPAGSACEAAVARLQPQVIPDLLQTAAILYSYRVGVSMRIVHGVERTLSTSLSGLQEVERALTASPGPPEYASYLREARGFFEEDVAGAVRFGSLLKVLFLGGWKQDAWFTATAWLCHVLRRLVLSPGPLLSYVPTCYVDMVLDELRVLRKEPFRPVPELLDHGLHDMLGLLVHLVSDPRIINPEVKASLLTTLASLVESQEMLSALEVNPDALARLVLAVVTSFENRTWHSVPAILQRLVGGGGFGQAKNEFSSRVFRDVAESCLQPSSPFLQALLNRMFTALNWVVTEFTVTVSELYESRSSGRRQLAEVQQSYRKAGDMCGLLASLLRTLEFLSCQMPSAFLQSSPHNLNRLLEVLMFVLSHFTVGADARRLTELLASSSSAAGESSHSTLSSLVRMERSMLSDKVNKAAVLAPVVGILLGLWRGDKAGAGSSSHAHQHTSRDGPAVSTAATNVVTGSTGTARPASAEPESHEVDIRLSDSSSGDEDSADSPSSSRNKPYGGVPTFTSSARNARLAMQASLSRQLTIPEPSAQLDTDIEIFVPTLLERLAQHSDARLRSHLAYLRAADWTKLLPGQDTAADVAEFHELLDALDEQLGGGQAIDSHIQASTPGAASIPGTPTPHPGPSVPEELLDPITTDLMSDPVILPDSQVTVDRGTIERHLMGGNDTDPFSRTPLTMEMLKPNIEVRAKLAAWRAGRPSPSPRGRGPAV